MNAVFVDTGAWYARFVPTDPDHAAARACLADNRRLLVTTDYVVDELLTLLRVRGENRRALEVGPRLIHGEVCDLEWVTPRDVEDAWQVFVAYQDKGWSFTHCISRVVMNRLEIEIAFAFDDHFRQFGTVTVMP
jgi:predicted nucleic acid-binding protein